MLETFKARLKVKTSASGVNLSQKRIDAIADRLHKKFPELTEEADHDQKLDDLNELTPFDEIAKQDDKIRTLENKPKPTDPKPADPKPEDPKPTDPPKDEPPAWAKTLIEEVQTLRKEKVQSTISEKVSAHEKLKGIPKSFMEGRALPEKEEDIDAFVDNVSAKWVETKQALADEGFSTGVKPVVPKPNTGGGADKVSSEMKDYLAKKNGAEKKES